MIGCIVIMIRFCGEKAFSFQRKGERSRRIIKQKRTKETVGVVWKMPGRRSEGDTKVQKRTMCLPKPRQLVFV